MEMMKSANGRSAMKIEYSGATAASVKGSGEPNPGDALKATPFQRNNHYVARLYLKRFETSPGRVSTYRILVADHRVPLWKPCAVKGIAYHAYLYTRIAAGFESDEIEKWLNTEFESPAEEALMKATCDMRLSRNDWRNLVHFVAAQDVRTPVRLQEDLQRWNKSLQGVLDSTLQDAVRRLESAKKSGQAVSTAKSFNSEYIPLRVTTAIEPGQKFGTVKAEAIVGRGLWFFGMRHLLTKTVDILLNHQWTILIAPDDLTWFTSDDPVIRLNYYSVDQYDFGGGWGKRGSEVLFPLDSRHLLYTKIGTRPSARRLIVPRPQAEAIRRFIAEHAHRYIFATSPDGEVPKLRPRTVDASLLRHEQEQWLKWHEEQSAAERELLASRIAAR
jgi:hypothetical protein